MRERPSKSLMLNPKRIKVSSKGLGQEGSNKISKFKIWKSLNKSQVMWDKYTKYPMTFNQMFQFTSPKFSNLITKNPI